VSPTNSCWALVLVTCVQVCTNLVPWYRLPCCVRGWLGQSGPRDRLTMQPWVHQHESYNTCLCEYSYSIRGTLLLLVPTTPVKKSCRLVLDRSNANGLGLPFTRAFMDQPFIRCPAHPAPHIDQSIFLLRWEWNDLWSTSRATTALLSYRLSYPGRRPICTPYSTWLVLSCGEFPFDAGTRGWHLLH
jgi:hypothetical protein